MNMIKVSATSRTAAVAGAIAGVVREHHRAEVQAIGAGAVNQAVKALIVATGYLRLDGIYVSCVPEFADVTIEDKIRTAIKLVVEPEHSPNSSESLI
jgi:stage V sporulation protein S